MNDAPSRLTDALADRYRLERELGAGGMATVYLAQDLKHDRKVALKVLRPELAAVIGADRFLAEIKTTANLQHPHILALFDSGTVDGTVFYVMPYVEGESLRDRLSREKQLPIETAVQIAKEVADALQYAHAHGVIHRDIKPENILLHGGHALVADFGIALAAATTGGARMTETGMSLGTPHYMSPEQAMGERALDARSDIYALGCVLYEMLIGAPPFSGPTAQSIVAKVMTEKPAPLITQRDRIPPAVEEAVLTALEKLPADRFASAGEFAAALTAPSGRVRPAPAAPQPRVRRRHLIAGAAALLVLGFLAGRWAMGPRQAPALVFTPKTFHDQAIYTARFAPDGKTIVYSAMSDITAPEVYVVRPEYPEQVPLGLTATHLLSVSSKSELAVLVRAEYIHHSLFHGTLARVPLGGGAPREVLDGVREADWSPDGAELAIIHDVSGRDRLEYPVGTVLYEASGYLSNPRVAPDGKHLALAEHPWRWDDRGTVKIVDLQGKVVATSREFTSIEGLTWRTGSDEVLFAAYSAAAFTMTIHAMDLAGHLRVALSGPGDLIPHDISAAGQLLLTRDDGAYRMMLKGPGARREIDASWLNSSFRPRLSHDGSLLAFASGGPEAGPNYDVLLQRTDGGKVARLGEGSPAAFSPDGKWVLAFVPSTPPRVVLYPTGTGTEQGIDVGPFESIGEADWFPDGKSILVCGNRKGEASRCYVQSLAGGTPQPVTPDGTGAGFVSPDGREVAAFGPSLGHRRYPVAGGEGREIPGLTANDYVVRWSRDGRSLIIARSNSHSVDRLDLATGRREPILTVGEGRASGPTRTPFFTMADDPAVYAYVAFPYLSQLFTVDRVP